MEYMLASELLIDPTMVYDASTGRVTFELIVEADTPLPPALRASSLVRACLEASGVNTEGWRFAEHPSLHFDQEPSAELVDA